MIIAIRLSAIFHRNRKDIDNLTIKIINIDAFNFNLLINIKSLHNNPLTLYSLKDEILQWEQFGVQINLVSVSQN